MWTKNLRYEYDIVNDSKTGSIQWASLTSRRQFGLLYFFIYIFFSGTNFYKFGARCIEKLKQTDTQTSEIKFAHNFRLL